MAASPIIVCGGLATDRALVKPPPGGLRRADNCVIDAPGVASARPNVALSTEKAGDYRIRALTWYRGVAFAVTEEASWRVETAAAELTGDAEPPDYDRSVTQFAQARGNLYLTTDEGVKKVVGTAATTIDAAGLGAPGTGSLALSSTGTVMADDTSVAYRWTITREDANGLIVTSAPAPLQRIDNESGGDRSASVTVALPAYAVAGDVVTLYRTLRVALAATAPDEVFVSNRFVLTSSEISAGIVTIVDWTGEDQLGAALYTNATREGIEKANDPPPRCIAIEAWKGSLWFGATRGAMTLALDVFEIGDAAVVSLEAEEAAGGSQTISADTTDTSTTITLTDTAEIEVGHLITGAGIQAGTKVVSIVPSTSIVMSLPATATGSGVSLTFRGTFTINGIEYYGNSSESFADKYFIAGNGRSLASVVEYVDPALRARHVEKAGELTGRAGFTRVLFERVDLSSTAAFTFATTATEGVAYYAAIDGGSWTSEQESKPSRLMWSKPDEPEHVPALNFAPIGDEAQPITRLVGLPSALLVFKPDGIFRVTGSYPNFAIDVLVPGLRIVRPECVSVMEDVCYAWTDRGVLEITENGIAANVSEGAINDALYPNLARHPSTANEQHGAFLVCWRERGVALLGVGDGTGRALSVYCFHVFARAWSKWTFAAERAWTSAAYDPDSGSLIAALADRWETRLSVGGDPRGYDRSHSVSAWTDITTGVRILLGAITTGWVPVEGDWISTDGSTWHRVTDVAPYVVSLELAGYNLTLDSQPSAAAVLTGHEGSGAVIEWLSLGSSTGSLTRELQLHLDVSRWTDALDASLRTKGGASSDYGGPSTVTATPTMATALSRPLRFGMPRAVARAAHLYPRVEINERFRWRAMGMALIGEGVSERVRR